MTEYKGLLVYIFRNGNTNCTNGGVSATNDCAIVIGEGIPEIFSNHPGTSKELPVLRLEANRAPGTVRLVPVVLDGKWAMMGGNFGHTSDSRFGEAIERILGHRFYGAVAIHDRCEG